MVVVHDDVELRSLPGLLLGLLLLGLAGVAEVSHDVLALSVREEHVQNGRTGAIATVRGDFTHFRPLSLVELHISRRRRTH